MVKLLFINPGKSTDIRLPGSMMNLHDMKMLNQFIGNIFKKTRCKVPEKVFKSGPNTPNELPNPASAIHHQQLGIYKLSVGEQLVRSDIMGSKGLHSWFKPNKDLGGFGGNLALASCSNLQSYVFYYTPTVCKLGHKNTRIAKRILAGVNLDEWIKRLPNSTHRLDLAYAFYGATLVVVIVGGSPELLYDNDMLHRAITKIASATKLGVLHSSTIHPFLETAVVDQSEVTFIMLPSNLTINKVNRPLPVAGDLKQVVEEREGTVYEAYLPVIPLAYITRPTRQEHPLTPLPEFTMVDLVDSMVQEPSNATLIRTALIKGAIACIQ